MVAKYWKSVTLVTAWVLVAVLGYWFFAGQNPEARLKAIAPISQFEQLRDEAAEVVIAQLPTMFGDDAKDPVLPDEMAGFKVSDQARDDLTRTMNEQIESLSTDLQDQGAVSPEGAQLLPASLTDLKVSEEQFYSDWLRLRTDEQAGVSAQFLLEYEVKDGAGEVTYSTGYSWQIEFIVDGPTQTIVSVDFPGF